VSRASHVRRPLPQERKQQILTNPKKRVQEDSTQRRKAQVTYREVTQPSGKGRRRALVEDPPLTKQRIKTTYE